MSINIEWEASDDDLIGINAEKALELFIDFYFFARKVAMKVNDEEEIPDEGPGMFQAQEEVRTMLELGGGRYEKPKKKDLVKLIPAIIDKVESWGLPQEVISHYRKELSKIVSRL